MASSGFLETYIICLEILSPSMFTNSKREPPLRQRWTDYISDERGDLLKMSWTLQRNLHPLVGTLRIRLMSLLVIHTRILSIRPRILTGIPIDLRRTGGRSESGL